MSNLRTSLKHLFSNNSRSAKAARNSLYMILIKGVSICISFLYVPLLLNTLDASNYGVWLTLTSIVSWVALLDIGVGNGLRNKLSEAIAKGNYDNAKSYVSTAYISFLVIVSLIYVLFIATYRYLDWDAILVGGNRKVPYIYKIVLMVFSGFVLQFFFGLINSILLAIQKAAMSSFILTIGQLISYLSVLTYVKGFGNSSMLGLSVIISFIPPSVLFIASLILLRFKLSKISPSISYFRIGLIKDLFSIGLQFFFIQIITIFLFQSNNIIITQILSSKAVVQYNIAHKYMNLLVICFNIIATPIWSATTEAWSKDDISWIKLTNNRLIKLSMCLSAIGFIMLVISPWVYKLWIADEVDMSLGVTATLWVYSVFMMLYGSYGYILNGIGKLRIQIYATLLIAIIYIPMTIWLGRIFGILGILIAFAISAAMNIIWSRIQYYKLISGTAKGVWVR